MASQAGGFRLTAVNAGAQRLGLARGELLADARARVPNLAVRDADLPKDREALTRLARWCGRYSPYVAPWPENEADPVHGLTLDITGCAHLFGGEEDFARTVLNALNALGAEARLVIADTIGAACALARYRKERIGIIPSGEEQAAIAGLPVTALRLEKSVAATLRRLGLHRIGDVAGLPRASLTQRFGTGLVTRLEQALGYASEPFSPLLPHAPYRASLVLPEPILSQEHVLELARRLACDLAPVLARDGKGGREWKLTLFRVDGETAEIVIRLAEAMNEPEHMVKLFALKLDAAVEDYDAGFGYEAARLDVLSAEPLRQNQTTLAPDEDEQERPIHLLIDRLGSRLGVENILKLHPQESHIPERAVIARAAAHHPEAHWEDAMPTRPLLMLAAAEPAEVVALLPEGPPRQFRWRGVLYAVASADGPERIRPEWWRDRDEGEQERDYFTVEDEDGRRFWLYRHGRYGMGAAPKWFVHGVYA